jgi:hypothetical protein
MNYRKVKEVYKTFIPYDTDNVYEYIVKVIKDIMYSVDYSYNVEDGSFDYSYGSINGRHSVAPQIICEGNAFTDGYCGDEVELIVSSVPVEGKNDLLEDLEQGVDLDDIYKDAKEKGFWVGVKVIDEEENKFTLALYWTNCKEEE